jgi:DNA-binding MarR family transcriptional regulator
MSADDLLQCAIERFWDTVPTVWGRVRGNARANATQDFNLTLIQFHIMLHIRHGVHTICDLAERQQISRPAISQSVELLVEKGLVTRRQDVHDHRFVQIDLTDRGNRLLDTVYGKNHIWMAGKMASLSLNELETVINAMNILKNTFDTAEAVPIAVK